jgi:hypothetical protein
MKKEIYIGREELADGTIMQEAAFTTVEATENYLKKCMGRNWYSDANIREHGNGWTCEKVVEKEIHGSNDKHTISELQRRELAIHSMEIDGSY